MGKVNFFILGAPKCGTTAMVDYLGQHPEVFFPKIKEPHYFCTDFENYRRLKSPENYSALYPFDDEACRVYGDASVWYLYSKEAIKAIQAYNPEAHFLIMLRKPEEMLPSLHSQLVYSGREDTNDFEDAWAKVEARKVGNDVPKNALAVEHLYYDEVCNYAEQIERVYEYFSRDKVMVMLFEEFVADTPAAVRKVFDFVGVTSDVKVEISVINQNREHRYPRLANFLMFPPFPLNVVKSLIKRIGLVRRAVPMRSVYQKMSTQKARKALNASLIENIKAQYKDSVQSLEKLLNKDLSSWK